MTYNGTESLTIDFEMPVGSPQINDNFDDDMESGNNGWTPGGSWGLSTTTSVSPTHSWYVKDPPSQVDDILVMPVLNNLPANSRLLFQNNFETQRNIDGGVLEYTINGGTDWIDAGELFVANGYTSQIGTSVNSPLAGRPAWTDTSGGWQLVEADLSSLAGNDLQLRFRFASDEAVGGVGWYIDDVVVESVDYVCDALLAPPGEASDPVLGDAPFFIEKAGGGYDLAWSRPTTGGAVMEYRLYNTPLGPASFAVPECETDLGSGTSAVLSELTADRGFLVVPVNSLGEGSYGKDSGGGERPHAASVCP
jgi:hypothetical protein